MQITTRLRHHLFRDKFRASNPNNFGDQVPPFGPFMGRREFSPPRYPNMPPFQKDPFGRPFDERPIFGNMMHSPGVPRGVERSGPWPPQVTDISFLRLFTSSSCCLLGHYILVCSKYTELTQTKACFEMGSLNFKSFDFTT